MLKFWPEFFQVMEKNSILGKNEPFKESQHFIGLFLKKLHLF